MGAESAVETVSERSRGLGLGSATAIWIGIALITAASLDQIFPGIDARFALVWGDELAHGDIPNFDQAVPAKHPLTLALGAILSLAGPTGARSAYGAISLLTLFFTVYAAFRLGRAVAGREAGILAAVLVALQPTIIIQAATAGKDLPFVALVFMAAALALEGTERNWARVLGLLGVAGLIRPESWVLAGLYGLWLLWLGPRRYSRLAVIVLVGLAPLIWVATDTALTGDPIHTLNHAKEKKALKADEGFSEPTSGAAPQGFAKYFKGLRLGIPGAIGWPMTIAALLVGGWTLRRARWAEKPKARDEWVPPPNLKRAPEAAPEYPLIVLISMVLAGLGFAILLVIMGLPLVERFLLIPALILLVITATALPRARESGLMASALVVGLGGFLFALPVNLAEVADTFAAANDASVDATAVGKLSLNPKVRDTLAECDTVSFGGRSRGKVQLGRTVVAPELGIPIDQIELRPAPILRKPGDSAFVYGLNPRSKDLYSDGHASTTPPFYERVNRWVFASLCTGGHGPAPTSLASRAERSDAKTP